MGTLVEFIIADSDHEHADRALADAALEMQRVEDAFTIYGDVDNAVKSFNRSLPGTPVELPEEVSHILVTAMQAQAQSQGAFNPDLGTLDLLWGFSSETSRNQPPSQEEIARAIPPQNCIVHSHQKWIRSDSRCLLDFGAIAKGYAIDRGIAILKKFGIRNAMVNAGGDLRLIGTHAGKPWRIGIRHPRHKGEVLGTLSLSGDVSIVTSGDYERFFIWNGRRYHHILDPTTGYPATSSQSTTVIASNATLADAWSTALFVEGAHGLPLQTKLGHAALIIDQHGRIHMNQSMKSILQYIK